MLTFEETFEYLVYVLYHHQNILFPTSSYIKGSDITNANVNPLGSSL